MGNSLCPSEKPDYQKQWEDACYFEDVDKVRQLLREFHYPDYWLPILKIVCIDEPNLDILRILVEEEGLLTWVWESDNKVYMCTLKHRGVLNYSAPDYIYHHITNEVIRKYLFGKIKCYVKKSNGVNRDKDYVTYPAPYNTIIYRF